MKNQKKRKHVKGVRTTHERRSDVGGNQLKNLVITWGQLIKKKDGVSDEKFGRGYLRKRGKSQLAPQEKSKKVGSSQLRMNGYKEAYRSKKRREWSSGWEKSTAIGESKGVLLVREEDCFLRPDQG